MALCGCRPSISASMSAEEEEAYHQVTAILNNSKKLASKLSSIPTLVSLRNVIKEPPVEDELPSTLLKPNQGHHALFRALEELDKLDSEVILEQDSLHQITATVTNEPLQDTQDALAALQAIGMSIPRRVCQHPFKKNDIVWVCRTCQADETCVLCHACYSTSNHEGHDVAFYHAQAGGCCDCGDPDAWDPAGFCPHHGPSDVQGGLDTAVVNRVKGIVPAIVDWLVTTIAANAETAHQRAKPVKPEVKREESMNDNESSADEEEDSMAVDLEHTFVPQAASTSKSIHGSVNTSMLSESDGPSVTQKLGADGLQGHGLFLVLHADDIHTSSQVIDALRDLYGGSSYFNDMLLGKIARALRHHGQLVVWGTMEVVGVCSNTHVNCWLDADVVASSRIGSIILEKASRLARHGLVCSIATRKELQFEQRAVAVLHWLSELARSCDPLCQTVAESILPDRHLVPMLRSDFKISANITKVWHSLLLTLLAVPTFKSHLAAAYCDTYHYLTLEYAGGIGVLERSAYTLSVQFLNRVTYVVDLVQGRDLLGKLGKALLETFSVAATSNKRLNPNHYVLTHRRYSPCISDLKCVLNVKGMARLFASGAGTFLQDWMDSLSLAQFMDGVVWRTMGQGHVELESRGWVGAFNASISLGSLFERLLSWDDNDKSPIDPSHSMLARHLLSCVELNILLLTQGVGKWQSEEMPSYVSKAEKTADDGEHTLCPASLPFTTVASKNGSQLAFDALPIAQATQWSFHLPLHRFLAASLREACRRLVGQSIGMEELMDRLFSSVPRAEVDSLFRGLMEFPALVLSRAAQVRAGLWKRNGSMMYDQVLNYAEPPFCRSLRDADILLLQVAVLGRRPRGEDVGCSLMVNLLLHRFGIFDFMGFEKAPNNNIEKYKEEVALELYDPEINTQYSVGYVEEEGIALPWTYTPASDLSASLALLEEFLHLLIVLITELPSLPPKDNADHTLQAKRRLRREVVHRLASGPKTHSELAEVHHVLCHWDNYFLSEEGKQINPDDASGAALGQALAEIAERKSARGRLAPHHWELTRQVWEVYDPAFFHISMRSHQTAAENRPKPSSSTTGLGIEAKPFAPPKQISAHPSFLRLERDITADATVLAVAYRTLHVHCTNHSGESGRDLSGLRGSLAYHSDAMSETALSRVVHLLTLGAFAWKDARADDKEWRTHGGGSSGSIFNGFNDETCAPTAREWVELALMSPPNVLMDSEWYTEEENTLALLRRLAVDGGRRGGFVSQDRALRSGAAWLCEFAVSNNADAASLIGSKEAKKVDEKSDSGKSELERRKQAAKQKAIERMKAQAAKFAMQMQVETDDVDNDGMAVGENEAPGTPQSLAMSSQRQPMSRSSTIGSESFNSATSSATRSPQRSDLGIPQFFSMYSSGGDVLLDESENEIPDRLLKERPQCIICVDDGCMTAAGEVETFARSGDDEGKRKRSRRKAGSNALAFVGYAQASTVQKGGGGPPPTIDDHSPLSSARRFAGTHVALCGHAVHSECCESYLASVSHREDRSVGRRDEFRCPLCQRLSNCLVPFIDAGVDWVDTPKRIGDNGIEAENKRLAAKLSVEDNDDECMDLDQQGGTRQDLQTFLSATPWWVARNNGSVVWDGQCAFVSRDSAESEEDKDDAEEMDDDDESPQSQRRRVRSLRKKDLYAAWTAMMRTPRFVMRRRLRPKPSLSADGGTRTVDESNVSQTVWPTPSEETSGETVVWRRLMDLVADVAFKADGKRLGERYLHQYCGEFRHYITEKSAYNIANRDGGRSNVEWPACISTAGALPDLRRQELSREKLLAKLLMSVQAFTYSSCCESHEAKRVLRNETRSEVAGLGLEQTVVAIYSKYGINGVTCDGKLVLLPSPSISENDGDGTQPFNGRLGKLRHFGLAVMAACGAVSADLVQLVMCFPLGNDAPPAPDDPLTAYFDSPTRAPIAFPMLLGHVLTHVVAAMCAACGRAKARSDCLELAWPAPFSRRGSFSGPPLENESLPVSVANDCEGFMKLGILARMLQVLLNRMEISVEREMRPDDGLILRAIRQMVEREEKESAVSGWLRTCVVLLEKACSTSILCESEELPLLEGSIRSTLEDRFRNACSIAASEAVAFLSDVGVIYQMLVPGVVATFQVGHASEKSEGKTDLSTTLETLQKLQSCMGLEPLENMLKSPLVEDVVRNWFETARSHASMSAMDDAGLYSSKIRSRLFQSEGFRCFDWPMDSIRPYVKSEAPQQVSASMLLDSNPASITTDRKESPLSTNPLVAFSSKKSIQLLGGYAATGIEDASVPSHPRVDTLATSYTDLYATLGTLCADFDQTAVCLICGEVLNAGGKGECTKHSYRCGGGTCIFFLLQECVGLILHGDLAAYVHSPYVDSHGETPQYRGRPLNLDLDRYSLLHEMWSGHTIRQKVISERGSARQVIISDFY